MIWNKILNLGEFQVFVDVPIALDVNTFKVIYLFFITLSLFVISPNVQHSNKLLE